MQNSNETQLKTQIGGSLIDLNEGHLFLNPRRSKEPLNKPKKSSSPSSPARGRSQPPSFAGKAKCSRRQIQSAPPSSPCKTSRLPGPAVGSRTEKLNTTTFLHFFSRGAVFPPSCGQGGGGRMEATTERDAVRLLKSANQQHQQN